jgi:hypothetical protein
VLLHMQIVDDGKRKDLWEYLMIGVWIMVCSTFEYDFLFPSGFSIDEPTIWVAGLIHRQAYKI